MKLFNWIQKHKYPIMVVLFFTVVLLLLLTIWQAFKKDHSLDMVKQQIKLEEKARQQIIENRQQWETLVQEKDKQIQYLSIRDSLYQQNISVINNQLDRLKNTYHEKTKVINSFGSTELLDYFRNLPEQPGNEY